MSNGPLDPSSIEQTAIERAERLFVWARRYRVALMATAVVCLLAFGGSVIVSQQRLAARRRLTDAFAKAVAISDAPLVSEVEEAEKTIKERREERSKALKARQEEKRAERKAERAKDPNAAQADAEDEEAEEMEAEAALLAEQQAEDEAIEKRKRGLHPFDSKQAREQAAKDAFESVADDPAKSRLRALAHLEVAHAAEQLHERETVTTRLAALYNEVSPSDDLWSIVASRYATALEAAGRKDEALAVLNRFGEGEQRLLADEAGVQRARLLVEKGDVDTARDVLADVQLKFPNSPIEDEIRAALLEMPRKKAADAAVPAADAASAAPTEGEGTAAPSPAP